MKEEELVNITGGSFSSNALNALSRGINTLYDLGRSLGSAMRRIIYGKTCSL